MNTPGLKGEIMDKKSGGSKKSSKKVILIAVGILVAAGLVFGAILAYKFFFKKELNVISFVPEESQMVLKFDVKSKILRMLYADQYEHILSDPGNSSAVDYLIDYSMSRLFFGKPMKDLNIRENFIEYVEPEIGFAFFNIGKSIGQKLPLKKVEDLKEPVKLENLGVFKISNRDKVNEFFKDVEEKYNVKKERVSGYNLFISKDFSYVFKEDFLLLSNSSDILALALDTVNGKHEGISGDVNFRLFKKKISSNTVGFSYLNLNSMREDFYNNVQLSEDSKAADFLESFKLIGTSLAVSENGLLFETLVLPEEKLSPLAQEFFSQKSVLPETLKLFSKEDTSNVMLMTNAIVIFDLLNGFFKELMPEKMESIASFTEKTLNLNLERDILASLSGDFALSLPAKSIGELGVGAILDYTRLFSGGILIIGVKPDSRLASLISGTDFLMTIFAPPSSYLGVNIVNTPDGNFCYALTDGYLILSTGKSHTKIESCIKAQKDQVPTLYHLYEERGENRFSLETTGVCYFNLEEFYQNFFRGFISPEDRTFLSNLPEVWMTGTTLDKGYKTTVYIPLVIME